MSKPLSIQQFFKHFPNDDTCLHHLMLSKYGETLDCPKCGKHGKVHRMKKEPAYECQWCGYHLHPMAGTIFHRSHTSLQKWFYAIYLFTTTRHGVAAKELQRQLSVTYKTAWRMAHQIRKLMAKADGEWPLGGTVEVDETYVGGKVKGKGRGYRGNKAVVFGMMERDGDVMTKVVPNVRKKTLQPIIKANVEKGSTVHTDELKSYNGLEKAGYEHETVNHGAGEYAKNGCHVNTMEGYWARLKLSIRGTHVHVSRKHLEKYVKEFEYRYNRRENPERMFDHLLASL